MSLDATLRDNQSFFIFSTALMLVTKSNRLLMQGGACPEAIKHITTGVELISKQLDDAAVRLETEMHAIKEADNLLEELGIPRVDSQESSQKPGK